ncbi:hypothetical protein B0H63DRAFT_525835 [Podospora didyma]|uniref:Glutathione S-transferase n=1 Tax=Podospora didyma TaxID=330526 RepID=A0AAE0KLE9_9PEZI|nr:hypothetical protein B0H63DRAFT_525835 [Podospora didyma]
MSSPPSHPGFDIASLENSTRSERGFGDIEAGLASISNAKTLGYGKLSDLLSYLGSKNPLPAPITKKDAVWLLDNVAFRGPDGAWQAEFVAAVFDSQPSAKVVDAVGDISRLVGLAKGSKDEKTIERRIIPFLMDIRPGRQVKVEFNGATELKLGPGGRNGISSDIKKLPDVPSGSVVRSTAAVPAGAEGLLEMKTVFAEPDGWAVISDIDDTIKITQTSDPIGILRSTFVSEPTPVAGMPALYNYLQSLVTPSAPFFYLSASPYNLYPFLREFMDSHFPHGELILRDSSWMTIPGLLSNLTLGTEDYKVDRMTKVHGWLPKRKMILIGDSTQKDPESYGKICKTFPGWVKLILIRKVTDIAAVGTQTKNEPQRFEKAFEGVPRDMWFVFEEPTECQPMLERVAHLHSPQPPHLNPSAFGAGKLMARGLQLRNSYRTFFTIPAHLSRHSIAGPLTGSRSLMASPIPAKRQRSPKDVPYYLIYWPGLPGRGEHIRLVLEEAGAEYTDTAHLDGGIDEVLAHIDGKGPDNGINPPILAPPILKHGDLLINQTPNILLYLGKRLGLVPDPEDNPDGLYRVNELALTMLDGLSNEPHDCHHPIATGLYYEDQKEESKRKAEDYVKTRLPKFLSYFEKVLSSKASGDGPWLYAGMLTYADIVLFQCVDGVKFMFPKATKKLEREGKHSKVFALHEAVKERPRIKAYLESSRRQQYSNGIYRYYKELDFEG